MGGAVWGLPSRGRYCQGGEDGLVLSRGSWCCRRGVALSMGVGAVCGSVVVGVGAFGGVCCLRVVQCRWDGAVNNRSDIITPPPSCEHNY